MKMKKLVVLTCVLFVAGSVMASNSLDVNASAAREGNYGLEVLIDGSSNGAYVEDRSPAAETTYQASFWVDMNDMYMSNCSGTCSTRHVMFLAQQSETAPRTTVFRLIWGRLADDNGVAVGRYSVRLGCGRDNGTFQYVGGQVLRSDIAPRKHVWIEWQAASAPGANDGICRLYTANNIGQDPNLVAQVTNLDNDTRVVDVVGLGARSALADQPSDADNSGSYFLDSFESYRSLLP